MAVAYLTNHAVESGCKGCPLTSNAQSMTVDIATLNTTNANHDGQGHSQSRPSTPTPREIIGINT